MSLALWLVTGAHRGWHPGIGDPSVLGWVTFVAYLTAALACFRAFRTSRFGAAQLARIVPAEARNQRMLAFMWLGLCGLMLALGCNKQLDLQTWLIETGRDLARAQGWYGVRRLVQKSLMLGGLLTAGAAGLAVVFALRRVLRRIAMAMLGVCSIAAYVVLRAAMFNHLSGANPDPTVNPTWLLELGGIALVAIAAQRATLVADGVSR
jgi:hypothetical protein